MSTSKGKSTTHVNPLDDHELSDLTKKEIIYWSRKLEITPSELFTLSNAELDKLLQIVQSKENDELEKKDHLRRWESLTLIKNKLIQSHQNMRLKGGAGRNLWDILAEAASQIEEMYGNTTYDESAGYDNSATGLYDSSGYDNSRSRTYNATASRTYDTSNSCPFPTDLTYTLSEDEPSLDSTFEDSFQIDPNLASTPYVARGTRKLPVNDTFNVPSRSAANATYHLPQKSANATYNASACPANATYNASGYPANATYNVSGYQPNTTYNLRKGAANTTSSPRACSTNNDSFKVSTNATYNTSARDRSGWTPQRLDYTDDSFRNKSEFNSLDASAANTTMSLQAPSFRNFTDYSIKYSPEGTEENAKSISVESYDENSGVVTASSRSYSMPAAATPSCPNKTFNVSACPLQSTERVLPASSACPRMSAATPQRQCPAPLSSTPRRSLPSQRYRPRRLVDEF